MPITATPIAAPALPQSAAWSRHDRSRLAARLAALLATTALVAATPALAQNATWLANPVDANFNNPNNFTPVVVPGSMNGMGIATFGASAITALMFTAPQTTLSGFTFTPVLPAGPTGYTFTLDGQNLTFQGIGAGAGIVTAAGVRAPTFNVNNNGNLTFSGTSTAGNATLVANTGSVVNFINDASGGTARLVANQTGTVDFTGLNMPATTAGSIEGGGTFNLGGTRLTVGANNLSTEVTGTVQGVGGSLVKVGTGTLALTGINTYTGGTTIQGDVSQGVAGGAIAIVADSGLGAVAPLTLDGGALQATGLQPGFTTGGLPAVDLDPNRNLLLTGKGGTLAVTSNPVGGGTVLTVPGVIADAAPGTPGALFLTTANPGNCVGAANPVACAGVVQLTNANTYSGGTTISGGITVAIGNDAAFGKGPVAFNAGTVAAIADGLNVANPFTFNGTTANSFIDVNGNTLTLAGNLSGNGGFTAQDTSGGGGTLRLGNTNANFAGSIAVDTTSVQFFGGATAGKATIASLNGGSISFVDTSTAGSASISTANGGSTQFANQSNAGSARISNDGALLFAQTSFNDASSAGSASITNINGGLTIFNNASTAASASIRNDGASSVTFFSDTSTAAGASIANLNGAATLFFADTTAANASISNDGSGTNGAGATAQSATIFFDNSSAGNAAISNSNGGLTEFFNQSTAANATITTSGAGSTVAFLDQSSGGNARFITQADGVVDFSLIGADLGNPAGAPSVTGTTAGSIEGSGDYYLGGRSLTVGSNNLSTTVSGTIRDGTSPFVQATIVGNATLANNSGGSLIKVGAGTLTLTGANSYTGPTIINGGTLVVNGSITSDVTVNATGTLGGSGSVKSVTAAAGSVVAPGNSIGTLPVTGNITFAAGSTFAVEVAPGNNNADKLAVGGKATLNGGTVAVSIAPPNVERGFLGPLATGYQIINAAGGVTGQFDSLTSPFTLLTPVLSYDPNTVTLTLVPNQSAFGALAATPNQRAVGASLDTLSLLSSPLTLPLAFSTNAASVRFALDQLSGEVHASTAGVLLDDTRLARDAILARLRQVSTVDLLSKGGPITGAIAGTDPALGLTLWSQALGSRADADDGNASSLTRSTVGVFGGADLALLDGTLRAGLAGGYTSTSVRTDNLRGSSDVDTGYAAAYLGARLGGFALRGGATIGFSSIDTTRDLTFPGYAGRLSSGTDARTFQGFAEVGYGIDLGKVGSGTIALEPFAGIAVARFDRDASTERGLSIAGLSIQSDDQSVAFSTVGLRGAATFALGDGLTATPRVSAAYQHASGDVRPSADLAFLAGGAPFRVTGTPLTKDAFLFEAGVEFKLANDAVRLTLDYSGRVGDEVEEHAIKGGVNVRF